MGGKAITIAGFTGSGKTYFAKAATEQNNLLVFDINNEYDLPEVPANGFTGEGRYRYTGMNFANFLDIIELDGKRRVQNCSIIFEDMSGFLKGKAGQRFLQIVQAKRHTNNNYYFIFHSTELVLRDIYRFTNYFVLFRTQDTIKETAKRFPRLEQAAIKVARNNQKYYKEIIKLQ